MGKMVQDVRHARVVCSIVHETDDSPARADHLLQCWPSTVGYWHALRNVGKRVQSDRGVRLSPLADWNTVLVHPEDGDDFVWVVVEPGADFAEVVGHCPSIEQDAGRVTEMNLVVIEVPLPLQHTYTVIELGGHVVVLVGGDRPGLYSVAVVRAHVRDVAVGARTELCVAVARGSGRC